MSVTQVDFNSYKKVQVQLEGNREIRREFSDYMITIDMAKKLNQDFTLTKISEGKVTNLVTFSMLAAYNIV